MKNTLLVLVAVAIFAASAVTAKADLLFTGSQAGECCFNVDLTQVSSTDVRVTVTLTSGAQYFVDTGSGQHPGFAFNVTGDPTISITNLSSPWVSSDVHLTSVVTGGPSLGTFDYYIDNPGSGASLHNAGPLTFNVIDTSGISLSDFTTAAGSGNYFVADILGADGNTGLSAISAAPTGTTTPEPSSVLMGIAGLALIGFGKLRRSA